MNSCAHKGWVPKEYWDSPATLLWRQWFPVAPVLSQMEKRGLEKEVEGWGMDLRAWAPRCYLKV